MTKANFQRGELQAIVAKQMVTFKINGNSKAETKDKAVAAAQKALGDKEPLRARQIMNWMLRHEYKAADVAKRLKDTARRPAKKTTKKAKSASAETSVAA